MPSRYLGIYTVCTNKSFSDQNIKGNFLKLHVLKISNQEKFFEIFVFGKNDTGPEIAKKTKKQQQYFKQSNLEI